MATAPRTTVADVLQRLAGDMHAVAVDFAEPAPSVPVAERRIAEVERICAASRAAVRG